MVFGVFVGSEALEKQPESELNQSRLVQLLAEYTESSIPTCGGARSPELNAVEEIDNLRLELELDLFRDRCGFA